MIYFMLCYVSLTLLIDLRLISINITDEYQSNEDVFYFEYKTYNKC